MGEVLMPRLSDSMEEGTILSWLKSDGDEVASGETIAEIETDKATMPYEADEAGVLHTLVRVGETVAVGVTIATIGEPAASDVAAPGSGAPERPATPAPAAAGAPAGNGERRRRAHVAAEVRASPLARRVAERLGIELAAVAGSGRRGRIVKADVVAAAPAPAPPTVPTTTPARAVARVRSSTADGATADGATARGGTTTTPLSRLQATVARRMAESKATVPDFSVEVDVDMTEAVALRDRLRELLDPLPSINDLVTKAVAVALRRHPRVNGAFKDGAFEHYERVNVGVAVAGEDALFVPTVFDADGRSLSSIAAETRRLAARARAGEITPPELAGGTFTVSNLGMFGVSRFAGVVNMQQAAILCVGAVEDRPIVRDAAVAAAPVVTLTLVSDHRILYGADAARFLAEVKGLLEQPLLALAG
jgi:pyruvate dehydrogenase E2 component (dihydrolipoamide acetyltransferase)